ncbi:hypothetical protein [Pedobacter borealis]|uniref:hypothetical protein n=1 Tax=Pedobacter borealis TaxID=475254 RepID=UPI0004938ED6|nr:hypothetical protein [Pedobacter borealis]
MLYLFKELPKHPAYRLNKHVRYFFRKITDVDNTAQFDTNNYFHSEFVTFLASGDQGTLRGHFETFFNLYKSLTVPQKKQLQKSFNDSQFIIAVISDLSFDGKSIQAISIPLSIRPATKELFSYLYKTTLGSFGQVKKHYRELYNTLDHNICPFCGIERLNPPSLRKQDYDHILIQSKYAYSSINMKNLVPMGTECNRNFKGSKDVIYNGKARVLYYSPFETSFPISITLNGSTPPKDLKTGGNWKIMIHPDNPQTRRWEEVFKIKGRYADQMLDGCFVDWLKDYKIYVKTHGLPADQTEARAQFGKLGKMLLENPLSEPNLVKGAFYNFLASYIDDAFNKAVLNFINS